MTIDQRGAKAADGLKSSISGHPLLTMNPAPATAPLLPKLAAFAGAFFVVAIVGLMVFQTNMFASDGDESAVTTPPPSTVVTTTTLPATTVPSVPTDGPLPVVPSDGDEGVPVVPGGDAPEPLPIDTTPPDLVITSPADGDRLKETAVAFSGMTEPGAVVMAGRYEADVAEDGSWSIVLILGEGGNKALFTATDAAGNVSEASIVVYYDPPVTTTTTKPESEWVFTANAKFGECELDPPYDEYYGTAAPGTTILVLSDYGSGSTVSNAEGQWWIRVEFPSAPYGKVFSVKVKNETTYEKFYFDFVSLAK